MQYSNTESENLKQIMQMIKNNNFCCRGINLNNLNYSDINSFKSSLAKEFAIKPINNPNIDENEWNEITQVAFESLFHWGVSNKYSFTQSQCDILEKHFKIFEMPTKPELKSNDCNNSFYNFRKNYEIYYYSDDDDEIIYPLIRT
tara:strand:+ start:609 stop:1043 length:435 start_codon:yes stop_codon:yes gene_type:complete